MNSMLCEAEVLIVGGGPAGLATAIAARRQGFQVAVVDGARPPIDKACAEGLMPEGLAALREIGVAVPPELGARFCGIRFLQPESSVEAAFPEECGVGLRRVALHQLLLDHAVKAGVSMFWGVRAGGLGPDRVFIDGRPVRCRWIIGADGQNSRCRRWAGLDRSRLRLRRTGFRCHFQVTPWTDFVEVYWGERCQAYVTPVSSSEICVAMISRDPDLRYDALFTLFPTLSARLRRARATSPVRGGISASFSLRNVVRGRVALVGEASGSVDAITGKGLAMAFRQAILVSEALARNDLSWYQPAHRQAGRLPALMGDAMLLLDRYPGLRRRVLNAFTSEPAFFSRLLAIHSGALSPADLGVFGTLSMGWDLLTA